MSLGHRFRAAWRGFRGQRNSFAGASVNRLLQDWIAWTRSADQEIRGDARKLRARARELARNEGYGKQYLRLLAINVVGPHGFKMQSRVRQAKELDEEANDRIEEAWKFWSQGRVTVDGRHNLRQVQKIALRAMARDGEVFVRKFYGFEDNPHSFALQLIDADMLDETFSRPRRRLAGGWENEIRMGVEVDSLGRPVAYHFYDRPQDLATGVSQRRVRVPAEEILHLYDADRPNQTRGVTWLHATMVPMKMTGSYEEAELVASRAGAAKMGFFIRPETTMEEEVSEDESDLEMEASPGTLERLAPGEKFESWDPQHPVQAFQMFIKTMLRKIATGLGIAYTSLSGDLEGVNYSAGRLGMLNERDTWRDLQSEWIDQFLQPVYEAWMTTALLAGALVLTSMDSRLYAPYAVWKPRGWPWVEPLKDATAAEKRIHLGISSRTDEAAEAGLDFEEILEKLAAEEEKASEKGVSISGATPSPSDPSPDDPEDEPASGSTNQNGDRELVPVFPRRVR